jgi:hypothetical protein
VYWSQWISRRTITGSKPFVTPCNTQPHVSHSSRGNFRLETQKHTHRINHTIHSPQYIILYARSNMYLVLNLKHF